MEYKKELKFKTNLNCGNCVSKVAPILNETGGVSSWEVDTSNPDKILFVHSEGVAENEIVEAINRAGFRAELLSGE